MVGHIFEILIIKPIINLLIFIYAILPGHNFGLAIVIFTIIIRLLMWPLVKKQLHHAKAMKALAPEIKRIKQEAKGDRQRESMMTMALYKEREINPFSSLGIVLLQLPILLALYAGINRIIKDPNAIVTNSYGFVRHLPWLKELAGDIGKFAHTNTFLGLIDLSRHALSPTGSIYFGAMLLAIGSSVIQYFQTKQLMPSSKDARSLKSILKQAKSGEQAEQAEVNAAVGRSTQYLLPAMLMIISVRLAAALPLYWLASGIVAYIQQSRVLGRDVEELEATAEVISVSKKPKNVVPAKSQRTNLNNVMKEAKVKAAKRALDMKTKTAKTTTSVVIRGPGSKK